MNEKWVVSNRPSTMDCWSVVDRAHVHFLEPRWDLDEPIFPSSSVVFLPPLPPLLPLPPFPPFLPFPPLPPFPPLTYINVFNIIIIIISLCIYVKIKFVELAYDYKNIYIYFFFFPKTLIFFYIFETFVISLLSNIQL